MTVYVALLRAVNVGGTGKLPMAMLKELCVRSGFGSPTTYLASGNVVFTSPDREAEVRSRLEGELSIVLGRPASVLLRTADELALILRDNPFNATDPARTVVVFLDGAPDPASLAVATGWAGEDARLGRREIYIHYGAGMGRSKLRIPATQDGTARNLNTVAALTRLASAMAALPS